MTLVLLRSRKAIASAVLWIAFCGACVSGCAPRKTEDQAVGDEWKKFQHPTPEMLAKLKAQEQAGVAAQAKRP